MYENKTAIELLLRVAHCNTVPKEFGAPFKASFTSLFPKYCGIEGVSIACTLFLSTIHCGFSTERLHIYAREVFSICPPPSFNCKLYDSLIDAMRINAESRFTLLNNNGTFLLCTVLREDIVDTLDFITNR